MNDISDDFVLKKCFIRLGIPNEIKHFFKTKSSFISFQSLTSLKTALKNYTWKVCVLPQQNAFGRPFSLKKHEEMFCDFAQSSGFFGESRHTKCISLGEMHFWQFWRKTLNWTKWCSFYIEINFWLGPEWARFWSQKWPQNHIFEFHLKNKDSQIHWEFTMK